MDFTVILCTYNRAANLPACIAHLAVQEDTGGMDWELLVVDNNSSDDTAATVERLARESSIALRYTFEPKQGLSNARNCGIRESRSGLVAFIDDDILVRPRWLRSYADVFSERDCDAAGGPIAVESPNPLPDWIRPEMMGFLGQVDYGNEPCRLDGTERYPFGGNMAFQRRALERIGDFDPDLGRKGGGGRADELFKGEETAYFRALSETGGRIWYAPDAAVTHRILPYQLERRFFLTIHYNEGYQTVHNGPQEQQGRMLLGAPLYLYAQTLRAFFRYLRQTLRHGSSASMRQLMTAAYFVGRLRAYIDRHRAGGVA
jgi:glycosyltransferase involved in cell wall biosynthesis